MLVPYGVDPDDLVVPSTRPPSTRPPRPHLSTYDLTMDQPVPLLAEVGPGPPASGTRLRHLRHDVGGGDLLPGLLGDLDGAEVVLPPDLLADAVTARLPLNHGVTLDRDAGFGLGFMTPLSSHFFGDGPSPPGLRPRQPGWDEFRHMADPDDGVMLSVLFNAGLDADTALSFRRVNLVDAVYRALASSDGDVADDPSESATTPGSR